ncbi:MAG: hypothetical protein RIB67_04060 [Miltoncostaeaceae bacterium]
MTGEAMARMRYECRGAGGVRRAGASVAALALLCLLVAGCGGIREGAGGAGTDHGATPAGAAGDHEAQILATMRRFVEGDPLDRCAASTDRLLEFFYADGRAGCEGEQTPGEDLRGFALLSRGPARARAEYTTEADPGTTLAVRLVRREGVWLVDDFAVVP